jgi:hypothetical protein
MSNPTDAADRAVCGIPGIGPVRPNVHICHFYRKRQDLIDTLVPFLQAGLTNGERCLWITTDPFRADDAAAELAKSLPGLGGLIKEGQILIRDADEWYAQLKGHFAKEMLARLMKEQEKALSDGYRGLRFSANMSFFARKDWRTFMEFEHALNAAVRSRRMVTICSYNLLHSQATDVFQATRSHHHTLDRADQGWELI